MNQCPKYFLILLLVFCSLLAPAQKQVKNYIQKYDSLAIAKSSKYGIPASVILGVSIIESAAGKSQICKALNNYFGIKGKNKNSQKKMGYKSAYREYASDNESFDHFCQILSKKKFYIKLKGTSNYKEWLNQMNKSSYASAKQKWIDDIMQTIKKFELYKFDKAGKEDMVSK